MRRITIGLLGAALLAVGVTAPAAAEAETRTVVYRAPGVVVGGFATERPKPIVRSPPIDGYITRMHARLVDAKGRPLTISKVMLHHVVFINRGRFPGDRKPQCGPRFGEPFYGTGEENQSLRLPPGYGYRIREGDMWKMQTMLMSHQTRPQKVHVEYTMRIVTGRRMEHVTPYWVRVTNCRNGPSYGIPGGGAPGSVHARENTWKVPASGRIVAGGAHLHGGAHDLQISQPRCGGRMLMNSDPTYGTPSFISYRVQPQLHEPGPINTGWYDSPTGAPVVKGETLKIVAYYDAQWAHPGVMGVQHVYIAHGKPVPKGCGPLPKDARVLRYRGAHRPDPPHVVVPLTTLDSRNRPVPLDRPKGELFRFDDAYGKPVVTNVDSTFSRPRVSIRQGTNLEWRWRDTTPHKVSLANGPRAVGSPTLGRGGRFSWTPPVPGRYQLFCYLHPITMHQEVDVRAPDGSVPLMEPVPLGGNTGLPPNFAAAAARASAAESAARAQSAGGGDEDFY